MKQALLLLASSRFIDALDENFDSALKALDTLERLRKIQDQPPDPDRDTPEIILVTGQVRQQIVLFMQGARETCKYYRSNWYWYDPDDVPEVAYQFDELRKRITKTIHLNKF